MTYNVRNARLVDCNSRRAVLVAATQECAINDLRPNLCSMTAADEERENQAPLQRGG
jgi:hypothetical protein